MKARNKRLLNSWRPLMFKWAAWSVFGIFVMSATNWMNTEPRLDAPWVPDWPVTHVPPNTTFHVVGTVVDVALPQSVGTGTAMPIRGLQGNSDINVTGATMGEPILAEIPRPATQGNK